MKDDSADALELVLEEARRYLPGLPEAPVRRDGIEDAARAFAGQLPEDGIGTLTAIAQLIERGRDAHIRASGPRFFHWVIGGSTRAAECSSRMRGRRHWTPRSRRARPRAAHAGSACDRDRERRRGERRVL